MFHVSLVRLVLSFAALGALVTSSAAIAKAVREQRGVVSAAVAPQHRAAPCWYQVPGRMQLVNLNLAQEVLVAVAKGGMQEVSVVLPVRSVRFSVSESKAVKLLPELMALTQACADPS